jgi:hypothetical protein
MEFVMLYGWYTMVLLHAGHAPHEHTAHAGQVGQAGDGGTGDGVNGGGFEPKEVFIILLY